MNRNYFFRAKILIFSLILFILAPSLNVRAEERVFPRDNDLVIVIDPGHGGTDTGTQGGRIQERFMNLITAQALVNRLNQYEGVTVYMTRSDNDTTLSLTERAVYAKSVDADFVFSIHYNACVLHDRFGIETYTSRISPYNAYGYQFGDLLMKKYQSEYGIFPRGVKTRKGLRTEGDYYTVISANIYREIPAVIIEHCFADGVVDAQHTMSDDQFRAYGETDADAIAEFFGLKSTILGIDYTGYSDNLCYADTSSFNDQTYEDRTNPENVAISLVSVDPVANSVTIHVEGSDADGMMLYYALSTDGGWTWNPPEVWPSANALTGTYDSSFDLTIPFESGDRPSIVIKGYNRYDGYLKSNQITFVDKFNGQDMPLYRV
ncbi:MAG: N-acetylmuramoyl-L-alanine amidase [Lachnospiraceae bacterium]|nr:N-acetylmuramoyl-L-alanine amidase [Lachnospiraceae bacterium]